MDLSRIRVFGVAHWSARGDIDSQMWSWGLDVDEKEIPLEDRLKIRTQESADFVREIKPYFPDNYEQRMVHPVHIPGDTLSLTISLPEFKNPNATYGILQRYFRDNLTE